MTRAFKTLFPALPALVAAIIAFLVGTHRVELACDRAANACTWRDGIFGGGEATTFPLTDVKLVRYEGGRGRGGTDGLAELIRTNGDELEFAKGKDFEAKATAERAQAFFAGDGPVYGWRTSPRTWVFVLAAGFLVASLTTLGFGIAVLRKPEDEPFASKRRRNNLYAYFALAIVPLTVGSTITTCVLSDAPGTLVLDCQARCKLGSHECAAGGTYRTQLAPRTYTVDVETSAGWVPQKVEVGESETSSFVCK